MTVTDGNGCQSVADYYIDILRRPYVSHWATRYGESFVTPQAAIFGPKVMLIDETAGSGGDLLPWMFKKFALGKLVGRPTWGGLVGILGFPEIGKARADKQGAEKLAGYFEKIRVSGRRLNTLTESLLSLAEDAWNQQAGIAEEGFHRVSPEALVIQCISLAEKTAETRRHRIVYENLSTISAIRGDEARLRQVLEHLLNNAIRYSPEETAVAVKIQDKPAADGRAAEISIQVKAAPPPALRCQRPD